MSNLDSTQTVRAVSMDELYDSHRPKWYAIQLVVSDRAVNLDLMPRIEAFVAHRLYAVVGKQGNVQQFALRLGFFPDTESAQAICEGLRNYFASPSVVRVSDAEQARFAPAQAQAPRATVQKPAAPLTPAVAAIAAVTLGEVEEHARAATGRCEQDPQDAAADAGQSQRHSETGQAHALARRTAARRSP